MCTTWQFMVQAPTRWTVRQAGKMKGSLSSLDCVYGTLKRLCSISIPHTRKEPLRRSILAMAKANVSNIDQQRDWCWRLLTKRTLDVPHGSLESIKKAILSPPDPQRGTPFTKRYSKEDTTVSSSRFTHFRCRRWTRQRIHTSCHTAKEWLLREVLRLSRRGISCCPGGSSRPAPSRS
jgi:hypothetical protein